MSIISYAQNREDVLLHRVLKATKRGFYIDVGANDPVTYSVTKLFYELGWSGVNIEPSTEHYKRLISDRPRDTNLNLGLSNQSQILTFFEFADPYSGYSTFDEAEAKQRAAEGHTYEERKVETRTLAKVCEEFAPGAIDFISIDVEGHEREVLEGADWKRFRPRIVVVEATKPTTPIPNHDGWEQLLLDADYVFASFDGLNRYYVPKENAEDLALLQTPVNIFDDYVPFDVVRRIAELQGQVKTYRWLTLGLLEPVLWAARKTKKQILERLARQR